jgi:hypothetical protein
VQHGSRWFGAAIADGKARIAAGFPSGDRNV